MNPFLKIVVMVWTLPNSVLGIGVGLIGICFGTRMQVRRGCLEFHSGLIRKLLERIPPGSQTSAMTLGHTILGQTPIVLDRVRDHEHAHVRQYERWGPLFLPAYLGCSLVLWLRRRDPYLENPFEVEAYAVSDPRDSNAQGGDDLINEEEPPYVPPLGKGGKAS